MTESRDQDRTGGQGRADRQVGEIPASVEDMRAAPRFALLLRTAKLVCDHGEFLCLLRDVSATGLKARLFHPLPPGERFALELGAGERFPLERMWERDGHAGFRFAEGPVDVAALMSEAGPFAKRPLRIALGRPAMATAEGVASAVVLQNLSQHGAAIRCDRHFAIGQPLRLEVDGLPGVDAKVRWRKRGDYGLIFLQTFRFDELARLVAAIQPSATPAARSARQAPAAPSGAASLCA